MRGRESSQAHDGGRIRAVKAKNRKALARIRAIAKAIEQMPPVLLGEVHKTVGRRVRSLISEGFEARQAPDGKAWAKRADDKPHPILEETGKMRRGWRVITSPKGITAKNKVKHTRFHQFGTRTMTARPMVPMRGRLPDKWRVAILKSAKNAVGRVLRKTI
jgi:phage gpG-like protein